MTALVDGLRAWWRRLNAPPAWLPDPVRWTVQLPSVRTDPTAFVAELNETETHDGHGWSIEAAMPDGNDEDGCRLRLVRDDGRYRWRDDGMRGL